jgi:hypothetical protein
MRLPAALEFGRRAAEVGRRGSDRRYKEWIDCYLWHDRGSEGFRECAATLRPATGTLCRLITRRLPAIVLKTPAFESSR